MKKVFIISLVLLVVVLFFLGIYNFAFKKSTPIVAQPATQENPTDVKKITDQETPEKISVISSQPVLGPFFDKKSGTISYYSAKDGTVWTVNADGSGEKQIVSKTLDGLKNVLWSPDHSKVLTTFEKNGQQSFYQYDYNTNKGTQLKNGLDTVAWDNTGAKIFYKYYDSTTQKRSINIADPDGSGWQKIADTEFKNVSISPVPSTSNVSFWNFPNADEETQLTIVGAVGGEPNVILKGKFGADYLWSPDGTQALVSSLASNDSKMTTLGLVTVNGQYHDLAIPTIVSKCVWSNDGKSIYYALPGAIPDNARMPNDYQDNKFMTDDTFWKIDITTGEKSRLINASEINGKYDSSDLFLSATESDLYFINRSDQKLYKIKL